MMGAEMEIVLVIGLIIVFIFSFCGLLQKIRKFYEADQERAESMAARQRQSDLSFVEIHINPSFVPDDPAGGVYPGAPPPYTEFFLEPPPKYEDVIKAATVANDTNNNDNPRIT